VRHFKFSYDISHPFFFSQLTQEKNELREEKATLKSEIDNLNAQYQQRLRCLYPWAAVDPSVVMGPAAPYPYPVPVIPSAPIPIHPLQPYPLFQNQTPGAVPTPCSAYMPYTSAGNPQVEHSFSQRLPPHPHPSSRSQTSSRQDSRSKSLDLQQRTGTEKSDDFSDVVTELELKTPGSAGTSSHSKAAKDQVHLLIVFISTILLVSSSFSLIIR